VALDDSGGTARPTAGIDDYQFSRAHFRHTADTSFSE
jgi:hypothetical protein